MIYGFDKMIGAVLDFTKAKQVEKTTPIKGKPLAADKLAKARAALASLRKDYETSARSTPRMRAIYRFNR